MTQNFDAVIMHPPKRDAYRQNSCYQNNSTTHRGPFHLHLHLPCLSYKHPSHILLLFEQTKPLLFFKSPCFLTKIQRHTKQMDPHAKQMDLHTDWLNSQGLCILRSNGLCCNHATILYLFWQACRSMSVLRATIWWMTTKALPRMMTEGLSSRRVTFKRKSWTQGYNKNRSTINS